MAPHSLFVKISRFLKLVGLLFFIILIDQTSKSTILNPIPNPGFFMGSLEWASPFLRVFCTLAALGLIVLIVSFVQFLEWKSLPRLVTSLVFLEAGIIGNGLDKLRLGYVRDFIPFTGSSFHFNIADVSLTLGVLGVLWIVWRNPTELWPKENMRNKLLIYPVSQLKMIGVLQGITVLLVGMNYIFFTAYLNSNDILYPIHELLLATILFTLLICAVLLFFGLIWSHRMFGPFKVIERLVKAQAENPRAEVKIRSSDETECVKEILNVLRKEK